MSKNIIRQYYLPINDVFIFMVRLVFWIRFFEIIKGKLKFVILFEKLKIIIEKKTIMYQWTIGKGVEIVVYVFSYL